MKSESDQIQVISSEAQLNAAGSESQYLGLIVNRFDRTVFRYGCIVKVPVYLPPKRWDLFYKMYTNRQTPLSKEDIRKLKYNSQGALRAEIFRLKEDLSRFDVTIPDREWRLIDERKNAV